METSSQNHVSCLHLVDKMVQFYSFHQLLLMECIAAALSLMKINWGKNILDSYLITTDVEIRNKSENIFYLL